MEFLGKAVAVVLEADGIRHFNWQNDDIKCSLVERFQRSLQKMVHRYFTVRNTRRLVDILSKLVANCNSVVTPRLSGITSMRKANITALKTNVLHVCYFFYSYFSRGEGCLYYIVLLLPTLMVLSGALFYHLYNIVCISKIIHSVRHVFVQDANGRDIPMVVRIIPFYQHELYCNNVECDVVEFALDRCILIGLL